jgi:hypothetical protein
LVVDVGETVSGLVEAPVFHEYVVAPAPVNVAFCPLQIVVELTETIGSGLTVTIEFVEAEQPLVVPVTVYVVVDAGETV